MLGAGVGRRANLEGGQCGARSGLRVGGLERERDLSIGGLHSYGTTATIEHGPWSGRASRQAAGKHKVYMKTFSQRRALQAVDLNSISNLYLASLQPYLIELSMAGGGTKRRLGLSV